MIYNKTFVVVEKLLMNLNLKAAKKRKARFWSKRESTFFDFGQKGSWPER